MKDTLAALLHSFPEAILTGAIAALALGWLGLFVVLRGAVFMALAMAEASVFGAAVAEHWHAPVLPSSTAAGLLAAALGAGPGTRRRLPREAIVAVVFLGAAALTLLAGARAGPGLRELRAALEGELILATPADLRVALLILLPTAALARLAARPLLYVMFDRECARILAMRPTLWETALFAVLAVAVATATRIVGPLLVLCHLVVPPAAGLMLCRQWSAVMRTSAVVGVGSTILGLAVSYRNDLPTSATIVATSVAMLLGVTAAGSLLRTIGRRLATVSAAPPPR
ncbi:MAG: metal ABC transporter permease [Kiritimatiellae bacterium]|nr:metal ABC transporter permease [Kiritimatiellia bacterium]